MKPFIASTLMAAGAPGLVLAQTPAPSAAKPAKPRQPPSPKPKPPLPPTQQAVASASPPPRWKHQRRPPDAAELEVAKRVMWATSPANWGSTSTTAPARRQARLLRSWRQGHASTACTRWKAPPAPSVWKTSAARCGLQLANKSMLMSQKLGQRLADECMSPPAPGGTRPSRRTRHQRAGRARRTNPHQTEPRDAPPLFLVRRKPC
jgi:hypothetical protein